MRTLGTIIDLGLAQGVAKKPPLKDGQFKRISGIKEVRTYIKRKDKKE